MTKAKLEKKISVELVNNITEVFHTNHNVVRWAKYPMAHSGYNELAKQSLNMIATFLLIQEAKNLNLKVDETRIPYIATKRLIEKTINGDIRDDHLSEILDLGSIDHKKFKGLMEEKILGKMSDLSQKLLEVEEDWPEVVIYKIATKMASLVESKEICPSDSATKEELFSQISIYREKYPDLVAIALHTEGEEYAFLKEVSKLRGAIRWLKQFRATNCSVLEHLGETAIFAWLMSKEENPEDEVKATKLFWAGLFHDLPERWTGDMASPVKNAVPGLRSATEKYEDFMMEKHVYSVLPQCQSSAIRQVMEDAGKKFKKTIKGADYASAAMECFRNIMCGSRDRYFVNVIDGYYKDKDMFTPVFSELIEKIYVEVLRS